MITQFSRDPKTLVFGILYHNRVNIAIFILLDTAVSLMYLLLEWHEISISIIPVSILGGALAIFLGFKNNSAYDRWWEARKIWGGIVNYSRSFSAMLHSMIAKNPDKVKPFIHRHISWLYFLNAQLRKKENVEDAEWYLSENERRDLRNKTNRATQLLKIQSDCLGEIKRDRSISEYEYVKLLEIIEELYNLQGKAERIKGTVFPYYYSFFTRMFMWFFVILLPFSLVDQLGWMCIPVTAMVSFIFVILEKTGAVTEDPFEDRSSDVPLDAICRTIEIDLLESLGNINVPPKPEIRKTKYLVEYLH